MNPTIDFECPNVGVEVADLDPSHAARRERCAELLVDMCRDIAPAACTTIEARARLSTSVSS
jgi:hypothetical protein